jgi:hypothetical protein
MAPGDGEAADIRPSDSPSGDTSADASMPCPCPVGWACSPETRTCQKGSVDLGALQAAYSTPYSIHWTWPALPTASEQALSFFEVVVGPTQNDVLNRTSSCTVWTPKQNPELAFATILHSTGFDPVTRTITDELSPATTYWAQLVAVDTAGVRSGSSVASGTTLTCHVGAIPVFQGAFSGWVQPCATQILRGQSPPSLTFTAVGGAACASDTAEVTSDTCIAELGAQCTIGVVGSGCPAGCGWCPSCAGLPAYCLASQGCDDVLKLGGLAGPLGALDAKTFSTAYLEFAFEADGTAAGAWSEVQIELANRTDYWTYLPWTVRADQRYRVVQLPLRAFVHNVDGATPLSAADFSPDGGSPTLDEFRIYSTWLAPVRIAAVSIKW